MAEGLLSRPVVPVASEDDARATAAAAFDAIADAGGAALVVHVVEKAGGAVDKASVEQRERHAAEIFAVVEELAADHGLDVETELLFGTDVADTIVEAAVDRDASAIVFTPRSGGRLWDLLGGDVRDGLVRGSELPVVVFPDGDDE